jgi:micrococcal nuclease
MLAALLLLVSNQELSGTVVGVLDGDTIEVKTGPATVTRVRLADIDAPEKSQAFGQRA